MFQVAFVIATNEASWFRELAANDSAPGGANLLKGHAAILVEDYYKENAGSISYEVNHGYEGLNFNKNFLFQMPVPVSVAPYIFDFSVLATADANILTMGTYGYWASMIARKECSRDILSL